LKETKKEKKKKKKREEEEEEGRRKRREKKSEQFVYLHCNSFLSFFSLSTSFQVRREAKRQQEHKVFIRFANFLVYCIVNFVILFAYKILSDEESDTWIAAYKEW
jgi:hypothetical protein